MVGKEARQPGKKRKKEENDESDKSRVLKAVVYGEVVEIQIQSNPQLEAP